MHIFLPVFSFRYMMEKTELLQAIRNLKKNTEYGVYHKIENNEFFFSVVYFFLWIHQCHNFSMNMQLPYKCSVQILMNLLKLLLHANRVSLSIGCLKKLIKFFQISFSFDISMLIYWDTRCFQSKHNLMTHFHPMFWIRKKKPVKFSYLFM